MENNSLGCDIESIKQWESAVDTVSKNALDTFVLIKYELSKSVDAVADMILKSEVVSADQNMINLGVIVEEISLLSLKLQLILFLIDSGLDKTAKLELINNLLTE